MITEQESPEEYPPEMCPSPCPRAPPPRRPSQHPQIFSKVLPHDSKARRLFVTSAGLKKIQEIKAEPGSALAEYIKTINNCCPEEIVKYVLVYCVLTWSNCLFLFYFCQMNEEQ